MKKFISKIQVILIQIQTIKLIQMTKL